MVIETQAIVRSAQNRYAVSECGEVERVRIFREVVGIYPVECAVSAGL